eukprot:6185333-Pleurochrysis_carterae.AAC.3
MEEATRADTCTPVQTHAPTQRVLVYIQVSELKYHDENHDTTVRRLYLILHMFDGVRSWTYPAVEGYRRLSRRIQQSFVARAGWECLLVASLRQAARRLGKHAQRPFGDTAPYDVPKSGITATDKQALRQFCHETLPGVQPPAQRDLVHSTYFCEIFQEPLCQKYHATAPTSTLLIMQPLQQAFGEKSSRSDRAYCAVRWAPAPTTPAARAERQPLQGTSGDTLFVSVRRYYCCYSFSRNQPTLTSEETEIALAGSCSPNKR